MSESPQSSQLQYTDLSIKGFRGIKDLSISPLARVNLITGKNNAGKSSILEALHLHAQNAAPAIILEILAYRGEGRSPGEQEIPFDPDRDFYISALFHGFPRIWDSFGPITISTNGRAKEVNLTLRVRWFNEEIDLEGVVRLKPRPAPSSGNPEGIPVLVIDAGRTAYTHRLDRFQDPRSGISIRREPTNRLQAIADFMNPAILVRPYDSMFTNTMGSLWDAIALTDNERHVVDALRIIDPRILAVSMVGGDFLTKTRTVIVRAENISRPVRLRSFGEGASRLFSVALSLVNARGGILLIDEFENGLHHTIQADVWRMIFRLAPSLDVQVFATTHSWDAIVAFQKAAAESPETGALVSLTRRLDKGDKIFATLFNEEELDVIASDTIEVR